MAAHLYSCPTCGAISEQRFCSAHRTDRAAQKRGNSQGMATAEWQRTRKRILSRDHHVCQIGGPGCTITATHVDHIVSRQDGGTNHDDNLRAACAHCNLSSGAKHRATGRRVKTPSQKINPPLTIALG